MTYQVKDSGCEYLITDVDSQILQQLLGQILGESIAVKVIQSLTGNAVIQPGITRKLLLDNLNSELELTAKQLSKLRAAIALGRQLFLPTVQLKQVVDSPDIASVVLNRAIGYAPVEKFCVLILDVKHRLIATEIISVGTATEILANPRDVFECILRLGGTRSIVGHNHPSGSLEPSREDISLTQQLLQGGNCLSIPILDHLIVSQGNFRSLRQDTALWNNQPD
ncbi:MAG TPA: JAB domain-containing protein [Crinalium sp.]|jgi:DNA repair protein RadC